MVAARLNRGIVWVLGGACILLIAALAMPTLTQYQYATDERSASTSLRLLTSAQADFRFSDRDGDGIHQFWRADIAGLYTLKSRTCPDNGAIKLIELSVAGADDRPHNNDLEQYAARSPKSGYWFRAIRHADEQVPAPDRYASVAFPEKYPDSGRYTFIVDERQDIYRRDLGHGRGLEVFPTPAELKTKWSKLD